MTRVGLIFALTAFAAEIASHTPHAFSADADELSRLVAAAQDPDPDASETAARLLAKAGDDGMRAALPLLFDPDKRLRQRVAQALARSGTRTKDASVEQLDEHTVRVDAGVFVGPTGLLYPPYTIKSAIEPRANAEKGRYRLTVNGVIVADYDISLKDPQEAEKRITIEMTSLVHQLARGGLFAQRNGSGSGRLESEGLFRLIEIIRVSDHTDYEKALCLYGLQDFCPDKEMAAQFAAAAALGRKAEPKQVAALVRRLADGIPVFDFHQYHRGGYEFTAKKVSTEYCLRKLSHYFGVKLEAGPGLRDRVDDLTLTTPPLEREPLLRAFAGSVGAKLVEQPGGYKLVSEVRVSAKPVKPWQQVWRLESAWPHVRTPVIGDGKAILLLKHGALTALNTQDGKVVWEMPIEGHMVVSIAVTDGIAYVGSSDNDMHAVQVRDGAKVWSFQAPWREFQSFGSVGHLNDDVTVLGLVGELVLFASTDGNVYAVNRKTGAQEWKLPVEGRCCLDAGIIYAVGKEEARAVDVKTRQERWKNEEAGSPYITPFRIGPHIVMNKDGLVTALDPATGKIVWSQETGGSGRMDARPLLVGRNIIVAGGWNDNHVYAFDADTGKMAWSANLPDMPGTPALTGKGEILVPTRAGMMCVLDAASGEIAAQRDLGITGMAAPAIAGDLILVPGQDKSPNEKDRRGVLTAYRVQE